MPFTCNTYHTFALASAADFFIRSIGLPTCALHTGEISCHCVDSKLKLQVTGQRLIPITSRCIRERKSYASHLEVAQHTTALTTHDAPVVDLCRPRVAVHLRQLQLRFGADSWGERGVSDDITECLSIQHSLR